MDSMVSFLHNDILMSTLALFGAMYSGLIIGEDTTHLHRLLHNEYFKYGFMAVFMYMFTRRFVFSVVLTTVFYIFFHSYSYFESSGYTETVTPIQNVPVNYASTNNTNVSNGVRYNFNTRTNMYENLQSDSDLMNQSPNQPRFIDNQLKPENIQPYVSSNVGADYLAPPTF